MKTKKARDSRLELLRVFSMFGIIAFHSFAQIGFYDYAISDYILCRDQTGLSANTVIATVLGSWGLLGVGCFFLISSSFLQEKNSFKTTKFIHIILEGIFCSMLMFAVTYLCNAFPAETHLGPKILFKSLLAPFFKMYWFVPAYLILYLLSPFLNSIIRSLESDILEHFVVVLTFLLPVYGTICYNKYIVTCDIALPIYYYFLWGYLSHKPGNFIERNAGKIFVATFLFIVFAICGSYYLQVFDYVNGPLTGRFSGFQILASISLFYVFRNMKPFTNRVVNLLASGTFGVYLLHEYPYFRFFLWNQIFKLNIHFETRSFIFYYIGAIVIVFIVSDTVSLISNEIIQASRLEQLLISDPFRTKIDRYMNGK